MCAIWIDFALGTAHLGTSSHVHKQDSKISDTVIKQSFLGVLLARLLMKNSKRALFEPFFLGIRGRASRDHVAQNGQ